MTVLDIKVEDAAKMVISAGLVLPGEQQEEDDLIPILEDGEVKRRVRWPGRKS